MNVQASNANNQAHNPNLLYAQKTRELFLRVHSTESRSVNDSQSNSPAGRNNSKESDIHYKKEGNSGVE